MSLLKTLTTRSPDAILFDWDNTLVDTMECMIATINHTLTAMELPIWSEAEVKQRIQYSARDGLPKLFGERWQEAAELFTNFYQANHLPYLKPLPGAVELLETVKTMAIPMAIVSNKRSLLLRQEITYLGWETYFDGIVGAGDAARDKPDPDPGVLALSSLAIPATKNVWFVGDAPVDWLCAEALGCLAVPIGFGHNEAEKYGQSVADCLALKKILLKN